MASKKQKKQRKVAKMQRTKATKKKIKSTKVKTAKSAKASKQQKKKLSASRAKRRNAQYITKMYEASMKARAAAAEAIRKSRMTKEEYLNRDRDRFTRQLIERLSGQDITWIDNEKGVTIDPALKADMIRQIVDELSMYDVNMVDTFLENAGVRSLYYDSDSAVKTVGVNGFDVWVEIVPDNIRAQIYDIDDYGKNDIPNDLI